MRPDLAIWPGSREGRWAAPLITHCAQKAGGFKIRSGCYQSEVQGRGKALRTGLEFTMTTVSWQNRGPKEHSAERTRARRCEAGRADCHRPGGRGCMAGHYGCKGWELPGRGEPSLSPGRCQGSFPPRNPKPIQHSKEYLGLMMEEEMIASHPSLDVKHPSCAEPGNG